MTAPVLTWVLTRRRPAVDLLAVACIGFGAAWLLWPWGAR